MINKKLADILKSHWIKNVCLQSVITEIELKRWYLPLRLGKGVPGLVDKPNVDADADVGSGVVMTSPPPPPEASSFNLK